MTWALQTSTESTEGRHVEAGDCPVVSQLPLNEERESYNMQWLELAPTLPKGVSYVLFLFEAMANPAYYPLNC